MTKTIFLILLSVCLVGCAPESCIGKDSYSELHKWRVLKNFQSGCTDSVFVTWLTPESQRGKVSPCFCQELECQICGLKKVNCD